MHALLLVWALPDYLADNDLGYHISLARQYAEHGTYWWDTLNWAPTGRPNLQGPLLHVAIAGLGMLFGGEGRDFVLAHAVLAVLQWAAAVFTAGWFARRFGGDRAALVAVALLTGSVWAAGPFFVGVPSGWVFVLTPWAIHAFLRERRIVAALITAAVMYVHLGGAPVAPFGILLAAVATRRWRGLAVTGGVTALLAAPYLIHFLSHLEWYTGRRGHVAGDVALLLYLLAAPALLWLLTTRPRRALFLLLWAVAPLAWLFQDALRFWLQSTVAGAAIAGVFVAWLLGRLPRRAPAAGALGALVALAQLFPLGIPAVAVEAAWAAGRGFPRELDWTQAEALAAVVEEAGLEGRIFDPYYDSLCGAISVFTPVSQQGGHWGEVRPATDPAARVPTGDRAFVLPLPPGDSLLGVLEAQGLVRVAGGHGSVSIVTLGRRSVVGALARRAPDLLGREARWLAEHAVNNVFPDPRLLLSDDAMTKRRALLDAQKARAGRIQLGTLLYAHALDPRRPELAMGVRGAADAWGSVANFLGDDTAMDYVSGTAFARFRANLREFAEALEVLRAQDLPDARLDEATDRLFREFF